MSNGIVRFKADSGQEVEITPADINRLVCPQATEKEVALFLAHCKSHRLDPIGSKDAYLVKYGNAPASIITGYQVFNRRARKCKDYAGISSGVVTLRADGTVQHKKGSAVYKDVDGKLIGGWAEVHVKGWEEPAYVEVALSDYSTGKSNWSKMPGVMIEKVAKASAWRLAYPDEFSGMYTQEEMDQAAPGAADGRSVEVQATVERVREAAPAYEVPDVLQPLRDRIKPFAAACGWRDPETGEVGRENVVQAMGAVSDYMGVARVQDLDEDGVARACEYMDGIIEMGDAA